MSSLSNNTRRFNLILEYLGGIETTQTGLQRKVDKAILEYLGGIETLAFLKGKCSTAPLILEYLGGIETAHFQAQGHTRPLRF